MNPARDLPTAQLQQLLKGVCQNNQRCFVDIVRFYTPILRRYARTTGYPLEDVEEAIQDTLLSVYEKSDAFNFRSQFSVYLIGILKNKLTDKYRSQRRHHTTDIDDLSETLPDEAGRANPEQEAESARSKAIYERCKKKLTDIQQGVLFWMFEMQATETETAQELSCEVGTVKSRYSAAREAMRNCLRPWYVEMRHG